MMFFFYASSERASEAGSYSMFFSSPQKLLSAKKLLVLNSPVSQKSLEEKLSAKISMFLETRKLTEYNVEAMVSITHHMLVDVHKAGYSCLSNIDDAIIHILIEGKHDASVVLSRFQCEVEKCSYYYPWEGICSIEDESDMPCIYHI